MNKPENGFYIYNPYSNVSRYPNCSFRCNGSKTSVNFESNPDGLGTAEYYLRFLGGWKGLLAISMIFLLILIITLIKICWRKKKTPLSRETLNFDSIEDFSLSDNKLRAKSLSKTEFLREDLPYHVKRIYLSGENNHKKPWSISQEEYFDIYREIDIIKYKETVRVNSF